MFITPLLEVAKFLAEVCTFARDICKPKYPVKGVFLPTTQKLGFLQLGVLIKYIKQAKLAWHV
jgi:hypothetical protein